MKLKMPGPNGIIILTSDSDRALRAENKTASLALEALSEALAAEELTALHSTVDRDDVILDKRPKSTSFKPAEEMVKFQVHPTDPKKTASIGAQVNSTVEAGFISEIKHPDWLANLVMVPKKDKSWRLCVDFKDLNKACPKDPSPSPTLIKSSTPSQDTTHCVSSMHIPDTIKSK